jgi:hypothetical protein
MKKLWLALMALLACGGLYFWFLTAQYVFNYISEPTNSHRDEYIQGAFFAFMLATPFWVLVSVLSYPSRRSLSKRALVAANLPGIVSVLALAAMTLLPFLIHVATSGNAT